MIVPGPNVLLAPILASSPTNAPNFRAIEGMEDHDVNTMFFWDTSDRLLAIVVNVSCPSQEVESNRLLSSDYWGPTREMLQEKCGRESDAP